MIASLVKIRCSTYVWQAASKAVLESGADLMAEVLWFKGSSSVRHSSYPKIVTISKFPTLSKSHRMTV